VGGEGHAQAALAPGKTRRPLYRRMGGPQGRSGWVRYVACIGIKISFTSAHLEVMRKWSTGADFSPEYF